MIPSLLSLEQGGLEGQTLRSEGGGVAGLWLCSILSKNEHAFFRQENFMSEGSTLHFDGERFVPECQREICYEHWHRYAFASQFTANLKVLDAACGEGYGAYLLADSAAEVVGVDLSDEAIAHAMSRYSTAENLRFEVADVTQLDFPADTFDLIVSFETLEHLEAQEQMLDEFRRVLRPKGKLVISTPDKAIYTDRLGTNNEFHVRELYRDEFETLVSSRFPACRILGQKLAFISAIWGSGSLSDGVAQVIGDQGNIASRWDLDPVYLLAVCAQDEADLPAVESGFWAFTEQEESVYAHYNQLIRQDQIAFGELQRRQRLIDELRAEVADLRRQVADV